MELGVEVKFGTLFLLSLSLGLSFPTRGATHTRENNQKKGGIDLLMVEQGPHHAQGRVALTSNLGARGIQ